MAHKPSPFLFPGSVSTPNQLAIVHLKRDLQIPVVLREYDDDNEGYAEGKVLNTRFGNFPHTTLIGLPWGSQVRASKVDTGSRGRRKVGKLKRKREDKVGEADCNGCENLKTEDAATEFEQEDTKKLSPVTGEDRETLTASSGFIHLLPPTPENWTNSLPHRTQVVYTPDYSYILHRIRARPGSVLLEAGAGSGSFTHAAARAVFSGYPDLIVENSDSSGLSLASSEKSSKFGKVWSYEFHLQRWDKLQKEIQDHGLENVVQIVYRDVCTDGFLISEGKTKISYFETGLDTQVLENIPSDPTASPNNNEKARNKSPLATAVFLDLPAPWLALPHLTRSPPSAAISNLNHLPLAPITENSSSSIPFISALDPSAPVHICTFSPCIEQVQRTVSTLRRLGWVDIETVELSHKRYEIRRERIGLASKGSVQRGTQLTPANVEEAVARLIEVEKATKVYHDKATNIFSTDKLVAQEESKGLLAMDINKTQRNSRENIIKDLVKNKSYKQGRLVHRAEPEVKTHTSYLVFAVLPQEWGEEDELAARDKWPLPL